MRRRTKERKKLKEAGFMIPVRLPKFSEMEYRLLIAERVGIPKSDFWMQPSGPMLVFTRLLRPRLRVNPTIALLDKIHEQLRLQFTHT